MIQIDRAVAEYLELLLGLEVAAVEPDSSGSDPVAPVKHRIQYVLVTILPTRSRSQQHYYRLSVVSNVKAKLARVRYPHESVSSLSGVRLMNWYAGSVCVLRTILVVDKIGIEVCLELLYIECDLPLSQCVDIYNGLCIKVHLHVWG